ncbi:hypothetical protein F6X40_10300 [Paraburkholderia sp. UCT31]|uniref:hypothetical protein n=1 Tax=Paraburkholderia sp. UCT31 TaxID=2615209 RepID=UPI001655CAE3|nr:hypothetical protein [Paraburkholderia sp. UCT31]MBC8737199.1 hypothetical protein [Paraburkholderia sp. UCT31]
MGRPAIHGTPRTASQRVKDSVSALRQAGGARKTFRLSPQGVQALTRIRAAHGLRTETEVIEMLLSAESARMEQTSEVARPGGPLPG